MGVHIDPFLFSVFWLPINTPKVNSFLFPTVPVPYLTSFFQQGKHIIVYQTIKQSTMYLLLEFNFNTSNNINQWYKPTWTETMREYPLHCRITNVALSLCHWLLSPCGCTSLIWIYELETSEQDEENYDNHD